MSRLRISMIAAAGVLVALTVGAIGSTALAGGVFTYPTTGGPPFLGSTGSITLNKPIVGIAG